MATNVTTSLPHETSQARGAIPLHPAFQSPYRQLLLPSHVGQREALVQEGAQEVEAPHGLGTLLVRQRGERRCSGVADLVIVRGSRHPSPVQAGKKTTVKSTHAVERFFLRQCVEKSVTEIYVQFKPHVVSFCTLTQGTPRLLVPMA
jgi:hypothetical protein